MVEADDGTFGIQIDETFTPIDLQGNVLASLPDGTHDTLFIDSAGHVVLEKRTHEYTITGNETVLSNSSIGTNYRVSINIANASENLQVIGSPRLTQYCSYAIVSGSWATDVTSVYVGQHGDSLTNPTAAILKYPSSTAAEVINAYTGATILYKLNTPYTIDLGYITSPAIETDDEIEIVATLIPIIDVSWWSYQDITELVTALKTYVDYKTSDEPSTVGLHVITPINIRDNIPIVDVTESIENIPLVDEVESIEESEE